MAKTRRRRLLTTLGALALSTAAGCTGGDDGGGETPTDTPTSTATTTTTPNQQALEHYDRAIDTLVENKEQLDEWAENSFDGDQQAVEALRDRLSTARDELDAAEAAVDPSSELGERITHARLVATFQEALVVYYDSVLTLTQLADDANAFGDNEQHARAAEKFAQAEQLVNDLRGLVDDMETLHGQIDSEVLDEPDLDYSGRFLDFVDLGDRRELDAAESYFNAFEQANLAFDRLGKGQTHWENEAFVDAREDWEAGRSHLEESQSSFEAVVDNEHAPEDFNATSIDMLSVVDAALSAFEKFVEATHEAEAGNLQTANDLLKEGFDILNEI